MKFFAIILEKADFEAVREFAAHFNADTIAERATRGEDVSGYFTNQFRVMKPCAERDEPNVAHALSPVHEASNAVKRP